MIENVLDRDVLSFEIEKSNIEEKKVIGSFQKNTAIIELLNPDNKYSNLKGTYIKTYKGTFFVNDISPIQEKIKIKLNCYDLVQKFDTDYDKSKFIFPMTLKEWKNKICNIVGVEYDNSDFPNCNKLLTASPFIEEDATYIDVIKLIARASACWAIIDYDDKLYFNWFNDDNLVDVEDWFDLTTEDESTDPINIVVLGRGDVEDNVVYPQALPDNPKEIRIDSNDILDLDRKNMIIPIYNQVNGFKHIIFKMKTRGFLNAKIGDKIKYLDLFGSEKKSYIMRHTLTFLGGNYADEKNYTSQFEAIELDETNTNYKYAESPEQKLNRTERLANKLDGQILDIIETVGQYDSKISQVEQTVEKIEQKVSEVADLTREVISNKYIELNDAILGDLISLRITGEISILPSKYMFPSDDLFPHDAFYLKVTNEEIDEESGEISLKSTRYKLPFYALHEYGDVKDEFIIDSGKVKLIKRIGVDKDDNKYLLTQPIEQTFDDIVINLKDGYNRFELVDFPSATLSIKYAMQSEYSKVFATKAELNSSITLTKDEINMEVEKKVDDKDYTAANIMLKINNDTSEAKINADKIELTANDILNLIAGNEINLSSKNIIITSDKFKVDKEGNLVCTGATLKSVNVDGGTINLAGDGFDKCLTVQKTDGSLKSIVYSAGYRGMNGAETKVAIMNNTGTISCVSLVQTSLSTKKKNFKLFKNAISLIKNSDIYTYNFKNETNETKKHIGLVIGDNYKCCDEVINEERNAIDIYSMISVAWQAIKEQQVIIDNLKKEIEVLKNENN